MKAQVVFFFGCLIFLASLSACSAPGKSTPTIPSSPIPSVDNPPTLLPTPIPPPEKPAVPVIDLTPAVEEAVELNVTPPVAIAIPEEITPQYGIAVAITEAPTESLFPNAATMETVNACSLIRPDEIKNIISSQAAPTLKPFADTESYGSYCVYLDDDGRMFVAIGKGNEPTSMFDLDLENIRNNPNFGHFEADGASIYVAGGRLDESTSQDYFIGVILKNDTAAEIYIDDKNYKYDQQRENTILLRIARSLPSASTSDVMTDACLLVKENEVAFYIPVPPKPKKELFDDEAGTGSACSYSSEQTDLEISIATMPGTIGQFKTSLQDQINQDPSSKHFKSANSDIYQFGGVNDVNNPGDLFTGVILKGDVCVYISIHGSSYRYDPEKESLLLKTIAARIP
jgi:hypothetical protein